MKTISVEGGSKSIVLDTVKRGEDDEDVSTGGIPTRKGRSLVLRFYDSLGGRGLLLSMRMFPISFFNY